MRPEPILLLTRPQAAAERFLTGLPDEVRARVRVLISPIMSIEVTADRIDTGPARTLILTSGNGVAAAARLGVPRGLPVFTVGETTARKARDEGWTATCAGKNADELVRNLPGFSPGVPILHLRGRHSRGDVARRLTGAGLPTEARVIYDQVARPLSPQAREALTGDDPVIVPLFSPRSAALLDRTPGVTAPLIPVALSPAVADALHAVDTSRLITCPEPTAVAMSAALCDVLRGLCRVEGPEGGE